MSNTSPPEQQNLISTTYQMMSQPVLLAHLVKVILLMKKWKKKAPGSLRNLAIDGQLCGGRHLWNMILRNTQKKSIWLDAFIVIKTFLVRMGLED
jgi:hypothetical protein